ncbi:hypothetical protein FKM82_001964 [Ascaphus truei]
MQNEIQQKHVYISIHNYKYLQTHDICTRMYTCPSLHGISVTHRIWGVMGHRASPYLVYAPAPLSEPGSPDHRLEEGSASGHRCGANKREVTEKHKDLKWSTGDPEQIPVRGEES